MTKQPKKYPKTEAGSESHTPSTSIAKLASEAQALRAKAEAIFSDNAINSADLEVMSAEDIRKMLHELHVHQIELEMQNEALRAIQGDLDASLERYLDLYDRAPVGYCTLSERGVIQQANLTLATLLGQARSALINQPIFRFIDQEDQDNFYLYSKQLVVTGAAQAYDLRMVKNAGEKFWAHLVVTTTQNTEGATLLRAALTDISQHKQAELALRDSEERHRSILHTSMSGFWLVDVEGRILEVNETYCRMSGYSEQELLSMRVFDLECIESTAATLAHLQKVIAQGEDRFESQHRNKEGNTFAVEVSVQYKPVDGGRFVVFLQDITERKRADAKIFLAASVFTHASEGIMITEPDGSIIDVNEGFTQITGYRREEILGCKPGFLSSGHHGKRFYRALWRNLINDGHWHGEIWNRHKNGDVFIGLLTISAVRDAEGNTQHYVALFSDITALKEHENELKRIAHYDALTTLPNRVLLADHLHQGLAQAKRHGQPLAVVYLDLDGFKAINDTHGHDVGDQLLIVLGARLKLATRDGDTLARIGGDEFVVVLLDLAGIDASLPILNRLLSAAAKPVQVGELVLQVSASLGVSFYSPLEDIDPDQLLRQADQAMYQAKLAGKNCYAVFNTQQDISIRGHHESLVRIRSALKNQEFVLYYQHQVNMRTGEIIGAEALIRWQHPNKGLLPPSEFLWVIEDDPLAIELGEWVIDSVLTQMALWQVTGLDITVSVNIGARQLQQVDFLARLSAILARYPKIMPSRLELEVLETSALEDLVHVSQVINACQKMGVKFSLDDFGTGFSSLTYLKRLPVSLLKIDQSFVRDMINDPDDLAIVFGVIGLAIAFRRRVIAEGVETLEQGEMLLQLGCELAQGYGIARPMPAHELPEWTATWRPNPSWVDLPLVNRNGLPVIFASVEFRAWITDIESFFKDKYKAHQSLDRHECHFCEWMDGEGKSRLSTQPLFWAIVPLHQKIHLLVLELCELRVQGQNQEALARMSEVYQLKDALLTQLNRLAQENCR
jgi:diguanylate cyclase (GGDEF)-like protein/PAS domain S-box-containing protein